jgi:N-acetyl-anhydromuramyl-L-alanine amidase AmpD
MDIVWKGNQHTNSSPRNGIVPFVIVNHISTGTMSSMDNWFTDPGNQVSSAHFGVARDGRIHQYVAVDRMAWANGIPQSQFARATAQVVHDMNMNPNLYTVSIEHEGTNGDLTEAQFQSSVWLHRHIRKIIRDTWQRDIPLDTYHVLGHYQINPVQKPDCPGPKFPWARLYQTLAEPETGDEEMEELLARLTELEAQKAQLEARVAALEAVEHLPGIPEWAQEAVNKAVAQGLIDTPQGGSFDFYRFLTILNRKGLLG